MATTRRKTTVSTSFAGGTHLRAPKKQPKYNIFNSLSRQAASRTLLGTLETVVPVLSITAKTAAALHAQSAGSTVSAVTGDLAGSMRFAVSVYPQRSVELPIAPSWELLFAFAVMNADLLLLPNHALGTWFNSRRNQHVLDVVVCPQSLDEAIALGREHAQEAAFDLQTKTVIDVPGYLEQDSPRQVRKLRMGDLL